MNITLIDNHDSFVYNLVDALAVAGHTCTVYRNTTPVAHALAHRPDLVVLSPGPGHPTEAGNMMQILERCLSDAIPVLGICLGFQALLHHLGGRVEACGPVHGVTDSMQLTSAGVDSGIFAGLTIDDDPATGQPGREVPIARYHSLGCTNPPAELDVLAWSDSQKGHVVQAGLLRGPNQNGAPTIQAIGLQFHPESVLSPTGPIILDRCITALTTKQKG